VLALNSAGFSLAGVQRFVICLRRCRGHVLYNVHTFLHQSSNSVVYWVSRSTGLFGGHRSGEIKSSISFWRNWSVSWAQSDARTRHFHRSYLTRGQSNLTKSASRGARSPVRGHSRGSKVVPLNSWGRVSYQCSIVTIGLGCTVWPQRTRVTTNDVTTQPISISASFTNVKWGA